ncbi:S26 family signal peptidase [Streptomyces sp. NPDC088341]|uniref:S26 family signal peptidase n=1 Tax=Streptomyces sp. NPDC088341 TaxID=3154870 RepID=UPI0034424B6B
MPSLIAVAAAVACAILLTIAGLWWLRRQYAVVTVAGTSMEPTFRSGERVVVRRIATHRLTRMSVVVVRDSVHLQGRIPEAVRPRKDRRSVTSGWAGPCLIKRVAAVPGDPVPRDTVPALRDAPESSVPPGRVVLLGDNPDQSYDSRVHGYFSTTELLGRVVKRFDG